MVELTRTFVVAQRTAIPLQSALAILLGGILTLWVPLVVVALWLCLVLAATGVVLELTNRFARSECESTKIERWHHRFIAASSIQSVACAGIVVLLHATRDPTAATVVLLGLLANSAMSALLLSSLLRAVQASLVPAAVGAVYLIVSAFGTSALALAVLAGGAQVFCFLVAQRIHSISVANLAVQAERDASIVELEQARLNSDEARRRAEEANLAKSRFLATMSHELRTPLNAILGFSEVMKSELFGVHSSPIYKEYSQDVHASGEHLLMLINEILDLSRVEAGRYDLREEPIHLVYLIEDCRHLLMLRADKRQITIQEVGDADLPRVWADERAMRQVILNLLSNAIKFTPQGGSITIDYGRTPDQGLFVSIKDTGPGIPDAEIPIVMSSFGRGTLAQKNAEEGSGLGLPIVKGLVEMHGGTFSLISKVRQGTEARVVLPPERVIDALPQITPQSEPAAMTYHRPKTRVASAA